jgi:hypothetical protein
VPELLDTTVKERIFDLGPKKRLRFLVQVSRSFGILPVPVLM